MSAGRGTSHSTNNGHDVCDVVDPGDRHSFLADTNLKFVFAGYRILRFLLQKSADIVNHDRRLRQVDRLFQLRGQHVDMKCAIGRDVAQHILDMHQVPCPQTVAVAGDRYRFAVGSGIHVTDMASGHPEIE